MLEKIVKNTDIMLVTMIDTDIRQTLGESYKKYYNIENHDNNIIETVNTPKGQLRRIKRVEGSTAWVIESFLKDKQDIEKYLSIPFEPFSELSTEEYEYYEGIIGEEGVVLNRISDPASIPYDWFKPEQYYLSLMDNENLIYRLTEELSYRIEDYLEKLLIKGVNKFIIAGCERFGGGLTNPKYFNDLVYRYDKRLVSKIHEYNGIAQVHMHGKVKDYLEKIIDMGFDCIEPVEEPPGGDLYLDDARKIIGDRMCILGNLDDLQFLSIASEEDIIKKSLEAILKAGKNNNYILGGTSSSMFSEKITDAFILMAEVVKVYGNYPLDLDKISDYLSSLS